MRSIQTTSDRRKTLSRLGIFLMLAALFSFIIFYAIVMISNQGYTYVDVDTMELVQTQDIEEGAPIAVIDTTYGEIRAVLYPEYAPETVKNFISLAESGYYDNTVVFHQEQDVYFLTGTPNTDGSLPDDAQTNEHIPMEVHQNLWSFRGAFCALNTTVEGGFFDRLFKNTKSFSGSRFMILGSVDFTDEEFVQQFREASGSEALANAYIQRGGVPNFAQQMTVFAQTYEGFDVIEAILSAQAQTETNAAGYTPPAKECRILSVTIGEYETAAD